MIPRDSFDSIKKIEMSLIYGIGIQYFLLICILYTLIVYNAAKSMFWEESATHTQIDKNSFCFCHVPDMEFKMINVL